MLTFGRTVRIHLAARPVRFSNGHHGLGGVVRNDYDGDPLQDVWVFYNRRQTDLKILWFDHGGFVVAHKKLARGRFRIPKAEGTVVPMTPAEFGALLEGIDLSKCVRLERWNPPTTFVKTGVGWPTTRYRDPWILKLKSSVFVPFSPNGTASWPSVRRLCARSNSTTKCSARGSKRRKQRPLV